MRSVLRAAIVLTLLALSAIGRAAETTPVDFNRLCQHVADLQTEGKIDSVIVPFGQIDIDNDGKLEDVSEIVDGNAGAHAVSIVDDDGREIGAQTCDECADTSVYKVNVVQFDDRRYVIEYSGGILARLWEALPNRGTIQHCAFDQMRWPTIEKGADEKLCRAALKGHVLRIDFPIVIVGQRYDPDVVLRDGRKSFLSGYRIPENINIDIDNDGKSEEVFSVFSLGLGDRGLRVVAIAGADGLIENSDRNQKLLQAQHKAPSNTDFDILQYAGKRYIEGRKGGQRIPFQSSPEPAYWNVLELRQEGPIELCKFGFRALTLARSCHTVRGCP